MDLLKLQDYLETLQEDIELEMALEQPSPLLWVNYGIPYYWDDICSWWIFCVKLEDSQRRNTQRLATLLGAGNPDIDFLYVYLLRFLTLVVNQVAVTSNAFRQYTLKLHTGPPGVKHLFKTQISLRRVLFASDIL